MEAASSSIVVPIPASCQQRPASQRNSGDHSKNLRSLLVVIRLLFVTSSTFDHLVMTETPTGPKISGFISGKTQARLVVTRRGEQIDIVCVTEDLACTELAAIESLRGWELVSACLEPYHPGVPRQGGEPQLEIDAAAKPEVQPQRAPQPRAAAQPEPAGLRTSGPLAGA
jgi:hypothetical protein